MTLIRELIAIPEQVHQGDFVLKLADGVAHAEATLRDYVVTPQLNACFNDALTFIKQSVQGGTSKAAYQHRLEVGARRIYGGGVSGRAGAEDKKTNVAGAHGGCGPE